MGQAAIGETGTLARLTRFVMPVLLVGGLLTVALPDVAGAAGTSLLTEPFTNATTSTSAWSFPTGSTGVCLTAGTNTSATPVPDCQSSGGDAAGSGALQLTTNGGNQVGTIYSTSALPTSNGLDVSWDSYQFNGTGADGISFDLAAANPSDPVPPTTTGPAGGSLGYAANGATPGVPNGYLGFGADVYGNYENYAFSGTGCAGSTPAVPESMGVRGPGNGTAGYCLLGQLNLATGLTLDSKAPTSRTGLAVPEEVVLNTTASSVVASASGVAVPVGDYLFATEPLKNGAAGTVWKYVTGALPTDPSGVPSAWLGSDGLPLEMAFGWASSTGGSNEYHQINLLQVSALVESPILSLTNTDSGSGTLAAGSASSVTLTAGVSATSTVNEPDAVTVTDTLPASLTPTLATGTGWTCSISGSAVSCTRTASTLTPGATLPPITISVNVSATTGSFSNSATATSIDASPASSTDNGNIRGATSTSVALPSNATTAAFGTPVAVTATLSQPGTVNFEDNGTTISGCGSVSATTTATCSWSPGTTGARTLTAILTPTNTNYAGSSGTDSITVNPTPASTGTSLATVTSPVTYNAETQTFTGTVTGVSGDGNPLGTVTVNYGAGPTQLCTSSLTASGAFSATFSCALTASQLAAGTYTSVDAVYIPASPSSSNTNYSYTTSTSGTDSITVNPTPASTGTSLATQTITFTNTPPSSSHIGDTYTVSATGGASGNPVTFTVDASSSSICSISGTTVTFVAVGACKVDANQSGDANYAATQAQQSVTSSLLPQTITFTNRPPSSRRVGDTFTVAATGGASGNPVTFSKNASSTSGCTVNSSTGRITFKAPAGTCIVDANQAGDASYAAAATVIRLVSEKAFLRLVVYFANDSWALTGHARHQLNVFAVAVTRDELTRLSLSGFASSTGTTQRDSFLGVHRAHIVEAYLAHALVPLHVKNARYVVIGYGASRFAFRPYTAARNRRTEITAQ